MSYIGDFRLGDTFDTKFTTVDTGGVPITLAGTPVISAYVGNSTTEITAGITLTVDFDTRTGLHNVRVVATGANGYATASNYQLVITTGTVGGSSVVGYVVAEFSIEARSAVMPTTAARTLDVTATGAAGIDWANVEGQGTTVGLTATTVATVTTCTTTTTATNLTTNNDKTGYSIGTGGIAATSFAAGAIDAAAIAADAIGAAEIANGAIDAATFAAGAIDAAAIAADAIGASELAADAVNEIADGLLDRNMATGTDSGSPTVRTVRQALRATRNRTAIAAGTLTVYKEDDTTASWTGAVTTTAGNPITEIDPASA